MNLLNLKNSKGQIFYGMHFYPGVAEYAEEGKEPYRVYLNEATLRRMDPTFAGRPIYVEHVDGVDEDLDEVRKDADGWVVESFFNQADGKHWVKFIAVSTRAEQAIANGMRLSNAYFQTNAVVRNGEWNGVSYEKEITDGEFEHLAIVRNPRYEESVIMTPEEFKAYNENLVAELKRVSNSKEKGTTKMKLNIFQRKKVENAVPMDEIPSLTLVLPKSGKEVTIEKLVNDADKKATDKNAGLADMDHKVKMKDGSYCNVAELVAKHDAMSEEMDKMKANAEGEDMDDEDPAAKNEEDDEDESMDNEEDDAEDEEKKDKKKNSKSKAAAEEEEEIDDADDFESGLETRDRKKALNEKKKAAKIKADKLRNARDRADADEDSEVAVVEFSGSMVERGKTLYGA